MSVSSSVRFRLEASLRLNAAPRPARSPTTGRQRRRREGADVGDGRHGYLRHGRRSCRHARLDSARQEVSAPPRDAPGLFLAPVHSEFTPPLSLSAPLPRFGSASHSRTFTRHLTPAHSPRLTLISRALAPHLRHSRTFTRHLTLMSKYQPRVSLVCNLKIRQVQDLDRLLVLELVDVPLLRE